MSSKNLSLFDPNLVAPAIADAYKKLDPRVQWRNPVMFVVYVGSLITSALFVQALLSEDWALSLIHIWVEIFHSKSYFNAATITSDDSWFFLQIGYVLKAGKPPVVRKIEIMRMRQK